MFKRLTKYGQKWLKHRHVGFSWAGFIVFTGLSIGNILIIDPLPFVDEVTLVAAALYFAKSLLDRNRVDKKR